MSTMQYIIRPATKQDILSMYHISVFDHAESYYNRLISPDFREDFRHKYNMSDSGQKKFTEDMTLRFSDSNWHIFVSESNKKVLGYSLAYTNGNTLELKGLFVNPTYHRMGIGSRLLEASLTPANKKMTIRLLVISNNDIAKRLYKKYGFDVVGRSDNLFFGAEQDIMKRTL